MNMMGSILAVGAGGFIGAVLRYAMSLAAQRFSMASSFGTFGANVLGCLFLGILTAVAAESEVLSPTARLFWATGLCGGFTTMSTFMLDLSRLGQNSEWGLASGYLLATLLGSALAFWLGLCGIRWLMKG